MGIVTLTVGSETYFLTNYLNQSRGMVMKMINVGVREAKMNLSKLLKRVMQGQEVIITDRGKPVGKIVPITENNLSLAERIDRMEEQGLLGPVRKGRAMRLPPPLPAREGVAQEFLQEDRDA
jgi:prevent-host-death family protein